jgi:hypothetical protein
MLRQGKTLRKRLEEIEDSEYLDALKKAATGIDASVKKVRGVLSKNWFTNAKEVAIAEEIQKIKILVKAAENKIAGLSINVRETPYTNNP